MADFTRFISYLYDYRAGERNRNLGFAKMEVRQGVCRLTVRLGHGQVLQQNMMLCGYLTEGEKVYLVHLGEMERGIGERQWRLPADNLGGCGLTLDRLSGLMLVSEDREAFLLSVWKDEGRRAEEICRSEFWNERGSWGRQYEGCDVMQPMESDGRQYEGCDVTQPMESDERQCEGGCEDCGDGNGAGSCADLSRMKVSTSAPREEAAEPDSHPRYQNDGENDRIAMGKMGVREAMPQSAGKAEGVQTVREAMPQRAEGAGSGWKTMPARTEQARDTSAPPEGWRMLCKLYPAARPFEPSAWEVLCISLQDIGRLPPENWVWGNNHFLLHGFYQYHHLILARHRVENRIYLGIPGEFGTNEKFMAAMFGLHQFQRERQGKSDKGYWLTPIRL